MSRAHWILRPLPNALLALPLIVFVSGFFWLYGSIVVPLILAGAIAGVVSGSIDWRARKDIASRLIKATSLAEVVLAYQHSPVGRFKNTATVAALAIAWFSVPTTVDLPSIDKFPVLFASFAALDALIRAALGLRLESGSRDDAP